MNKRTFIIPVIFLLVCFSCKDHQKSKYVEASPRTTHITICIQPFTGFPHDKLLKLQADLDSILTNIRINTPIQLPDFSWNSTKSRYRADSLIQFLAKITTANCITLGVTSKDISTTKGKITDWGVMGLGYCPGKASVVSTFRLKGRNQQEKLFKVAIHELGHNLGLPHCADTTCYMRDAEGKDHLNQETHFCAICEAYLRARGVVLK